MELGSRNLQTKSDVVTKQSKFVGQFLMSVSYYYYNV